MTIHEHNKHDGSQSLVGVNTFLGKDGHSDVATEIELIRSTPEEKAQQIANVQNFQQIRNAAMPPLYPLPRSRGRAGVGAASEASACPTSNKPPATAKTSFPR